MVLFSFISVANEHASDNSRLDIVSSIASSRLSPEEVVMNFYEGYLKNTDEETLVELYVTPELALKLYHSSICNYDSDVDENELKKICRKDQKCKKNSGNIVCNWDGTWIETDVNYFIKSQDNYPSWEKNIVVLKSKQTATYSKIDLILGDGTDPILNLQIVLIKQGSNWKINRVTKI
ncbi:hypothetical protein OOA_12305 [Providencia burhodogranariea DSM 19968]|uniref:Uncharacterized protein n=2 Tax=Providencia burhodogranariea TaxID=516074 RepID=K8WK78_9GAMM|nr:hypothetical protein OOA_12305 [Providencia burhodogranariea DSM 19968]